MIKVVCFLREREEKKCGGPPVGKCPSGEVVNKNPGLEFLPMYGNPTVNLQLRKRDAQGPRAGFLADKTSSGAKG
jgi:hypothetical protein